MGAKMLTRVAIVEGDAGVRRNVELVVSGTDGFQAAGSYATAEAALKQIRAVRPHVVLTAIELPGMSGIEFARRLRKLLPGLKVIMMAGFLESQVIWEAIQSGADGFLTKPMRSSELIPTILDVLLGGHPLSPEATKKFCPEIFMASNILSAKNLLSQREDEIIKLAMEGFADKQIASFLEISKGTVVWHWKNIFRKTCVHSRGAAIAVWINRRQTKSKHSGLSHRNEA